MRRLFVVICLLLAYGSLYPWRFMTYVPLWDAVARVFAGTPAYYPWAIVEDMALNVLVYAPLGLIGYFMGPGLSQAARLAWPIVFGFLFSLSMETLQSYIPPRAPSSADLACNTLGVALGAASGWLFESTINKILERLSSRTMRAASALMLLLICVAHLVVPLIPRIYAIATHQPAGPIVEGVRVIVFAQSLFPWLMATRFVEALSIQWAGAERGRRFTIRLLLAAIAAGGLIRFLLPELFFSRLQVAGAVAAMLVYYFALSRLPAVWRNRAYAALALVWLVGDGLRPYTFTDNKPFEWIPFLGMMGNDWLNGVGALLEKAWMYGATFWMWERIRIPRLVVLAVLLTVLAAIEFAQQYLPDRVSTMTDLAMGLVTVGVLVAVENRYEKQV